MIDVRKFRRHYLTFGVILYRLAGSRHQIVVVLPAHLGQHLYSAVLPMGPSTSRSRHEINICRQSLFSRWLFGYQIFRVFDAFYVCVFSF